MGIAERREREKIHRRNTIIDAAEKIFFSKGVTIATMDEVADEAELSKGTLYLYFKNKQELYLAINERGLRVLEQKFKDAVDSQEIGIDKVVAIGHAYIEFYKQYPNYFNAMVYYESNELDFSEENECALACEEQGQKTLQVVASAVQNGIDDGSIRSELHPFETAVILWGQSTGMIQIAAIKGNHLEEKHNLDAQRISMISIELIKRSIST